MRDLQAAFTPSKLFAPWLAVERAARNKEDSHQKRRRRDKRLRVKIGHGGTLDPLATGVLIIGVGSGTKDLGKFLQCTKAYETMLLFGVATDTYDVSGKILNKAPYGHITREKVETALDGFRGKVMQRPPIFSAKRIQGKRLYEYAFEGKEVPEEIQERPMEVEEISILEWFEGGGHNYRWPTQIAATEEQKIAEKVLHLGEANESKETVDSNSPVNLTQSSSEPETKKLLLAMEENDPVSDSKPSSHHQKPPSQHLMSGGLQLQQPPPNSTPSTTNSPETGLNAPAVKVRLVVTSGFYVRSFCHDLGKAVQSLGIMKSLVRTRQSDFEVGINTLDYSDLAKGEDVWGPKVEKMLGEWRAKTSGTNSRTEENGQENVDGVEEFKDEMENDSKTSTAERVEREVP